MTTARTAFALLVMLGLAATALAADPETSARSWKKQANDTRAAVVEVATELGTLDASSKPDANGLIVDAKRWLAEGDESLAQADRKLEAEQFQQASQSYNMAWQYYVKAATAGLNAKSMLTSE